MQKGDIYQHFKGKYYYIEGIAKDANTLKEIVIYHHLDADDKSVWIRPLDDFLGVVDSNREDNITQQKTRFVKIDINKERNDLNEQMYRYRFRYNK